MFLLNGSATCYVNDVDDLLYLTFVYRQFPHVTFAFFGAFWGHILNTVYDANLHVC